jgi:hypothetical protein
MTFKFGQRSESNLVGVHPDLVRVARHALTLSPVDFAITEGVRSLKRQQELFNQHLTKTIHSRHLIGYAIDVVAYIGNTVSWDLPHYATIAKAMKAASEELNIPIEWGGDWRSFRDGPHFQLTYKAYPDPKTATAGVQA